MTPSARRARSPRGHSPRASLNDADGRKDVRMSGTIDIENPSPHVRVLTLEVLRASTDRREAVAAFKERREPVFSRS